MAAVTKGPQLVLEKDAALRSRLFGSGTMRHPAKQSLVQLIHLLERYAVPGGVLLDPFAGSGSIMLGAAPSYGGMYVIGVELAAHFRRMQAQAWQHFQCTLEMQDCWGTPAGDFVSVAGDSRDIPGALLAWQAGIPHVTLEALIACEQRCIAHYFSLRKDYPEADPETLWNEAIQPYEPMEAAYRQLEALRGQGQDEESQVDLIVTSPSYGGSEAVDQRKHQNDTIGHHGGGNSAKEGYVAGQPLGEGTHRSFIRDESGYKGIHCHHGGKLRSPGYDQIERMGTPMTPRWGGNHAFGPHSQLSTRQQGYSHDEVNDLIVTSPPYDGAMKREHTIEAQARDEERLAEWRARTGRNYGATQGSAWRSYDEPPADLIITSPPYENSVSNTADQTKHIRKTERSKGKPLFKNKPGPNSQGIVNHSYEAPQGRDDQIDDLVVTSPPYHDAINGNVGIYQERIASQYGPHSQVAIGTSYDVTPENIGNLRGKKYLESMRQVWAGCAAVLRPGGILCCITRDCVQKSKRVPVGEQNKKLLEEAGLIFLEVESWRVPQMSFWRTLQKRKNPDAPIINSEQVWIFQKPN